MKENEPFEWRPLDTVKSIRDLALTALRELLDK